MNMNSNEYEQKWQIKMFFDGNDNEDMIKACKINKMQKQISQIYIRILIKPIPFTQARKIKMNFSSEPNGYAMPSTHTKIL